MGFLLPKINVPRPQQAPTPQPSAPRRSDAETADAGAERRRKLEREAPGRRATIGGGLGILGGGGRATGNYSTSALLGLV